jgi:NADH:ubiquinone oxidoreductase subunit E
MFVQQTLLKYEPKPENLLRAIKEINQREGRFSLAAAKQVAEHFGLPLSRIYSAASFYDEIRTKKIPNLLIQVCGGANCTLKQGEAVISELETFFRQKEGEENSKTGLKIERISCLGRCLDGPIMVVNGTIFEKVNPGKALEIIMSYLE